MGCKLSQYDYSILTLKSVNRIQEKTHIFYEYFVLMNINWQIIIKQKTTGGIIFPIFSQDFLAKRAFENFKPLLKVLH